MDNYDIKPEDADMFKFDFFSEEGRSYLKEIAEDVLAQSGDVTQERRVAYALIAALKILKIQEFSIDVFAKVLRGES